MIEDRNDRLKQARKSAGYRSAQAAADALGIAYPTYAGHENGARAFDIDAARHYAQRFKVDLEWLLTGKGDPKEKRVAASGTIDPEVLKIVIRHLATEYDGIINADPMMLADIILDLCVYAQQMKRTDLAKPESALAMKRLVGVT